MGEQTGVNAVFMILFSSFPQNADFLKLLVMMFPHVDRYGIKNSPCLADKKSSRDIKHIKPSYCSTYVKPHVFWLLILIDTLNTIIKSNPILLTRVTIS